MTGFLKTKKTAIIDGNGCPVILKGVNVGGWLMMEGYILHAPNVAVQVFQKNFIRHIGQKLWDEFEKAFRGNFITEDDIKQIADSGFNCIRVPFHHGLIEKKPFQYNKKGLVYLDGIIEWCRKYDVWVILDLHAAPGSQNHDWHSDSLGKAQLWDVKRNRERTYALWEFLADYYKDEKQIAGYDLLNEPVVEDASKLNLFYRELIKRIRAIDKSHILFVEGNRWATNISCLDDIADDNYALSIHSYEPLVFTCNFVPLLHYPMNEPGKRVCNKEVIQRHLMQYSQESEKRQVPVFCGEFGANNREGKYGELVWLNDMLEEFKHHGFHWTYWTYKAVKNSLLPDGVYSYRENPAWVNRQGPLYGWDTYYLHWKKLKKEMAASWQTRNFRVNDGVLNLLRKYVR